MPTALRNFVKRVALSFIYKLPPMPQKLHGRRIWVHPRARFSYSARTFFTGESHVRDWLAQQLKPGHVFFDIGAHHGWVSMWALPLVGAEGAVHSFEPSPANLPVLEWHRRRNRFHDWTIVPRAVSESDAGAAKFYLIDLGDSPMNSLTSGTPGTAMMEGRNITETSIQTISLDTYCREHGVTPNLIKIDVEGAELLVLRGASRTLHESHPTIILAVHPKWLPAGQSPGQIAELLKAHGYSIFNSKGNRAEAVGSGEYLCLYGGDSVQPRMG